MNPVGKRNQLRSSWWSLSSEGQNWLSSVLQRPRKKASAASTSAVRFGIKQTKNSGL
jgi:hypothetical protein